MTVRIVKVLLTTNDVGLAQGHRALFEGGLERVVWMVPRAGAVVRWRHLYLWH